MSNDWLPPLIEVAGKKRIIVVRVSAENWTTIECARNGLSSFSFARPHNEFDDVSEGAICLFLPQERSEPIYIGAVTSCASITTVESRIRIAFGHALYPTDLSSLSSVLAGQGPPHSLFQKKLSERTTIRASPTRRAALYVRVSTDRQTAENQVAKLTEIAQARGWQIVATFTDARISGAKGRKDRPGLDDMLKQAQRGTFDVVMAWAIDRVGRSLIDLLGTIQHLEACKVDLYLDQQQIDTTTPSGRLLFQVTGAFGEFERAMIRERVNAGLARAKAQGKQLGRPRNENTKRRAAVLQMRRNGVGINKIARKLGCGVSYVQRIVLESAAHG